MQTPGELVADWRAKRRTQEVCETLVSRAPNGMRFPHLQRLLPGMTEEQILESLNTLVESKRLEVRNVPNKMVAGRTITVYQLVNPDAYPMRETITVGGIDFP